MVDGPPGDGRRTGDGAALKLRDGDGGGVTQEAFRDGQSWFGG